MRFCAETPPASVCCLAFLGTAMTGPSNVVGVRLAPAGERPPVLHRCVAAQLRRQALAPDRSARRHPSRRPRPRTQLQPPRQRAGRKPVPSATCSMRIAATRSRLFEKNDYASRTSRDPRCQPERAEMRSDARTVQRRLRLYCDRDRYRCVSRYSSDTPGMTEQVGQQVARAKQPGAHARLRNIQHRGDLDAR